ncbi:hypothetical protein [Legionella impletisoli]|uniref:Thaumatin domain-containing protein n=1 Tax=Legionella impletisoli TaxID=343510 RepID=A0A917JQW4_9GAMM|nr:hypothetical protein [Legionella impletisoli]GGI80689.1 hypothetical protein GCM10007966_06530 [Legionella impletisoli]
MTNVPHLKIKHILIGLVICFISLDGIAGVTTPDTQQTSRFRVTNQCDEPLWIQQDFKNPTNDPNVVEIAPGLAYDYAIPDKGLASTRFWAKKGCNEHGYNCKVGESTAVPEAESKGWQKPPYAPDINSKFEATWGCVAAIFNHNPSLCAPNPSAPGQNLGPETWWNGSAVDGYTLPYAVNVINHQNTCLDLHSEQVLTDPGVNCGGLKPTLCPASANLSTEGQFNTINGVNVTEVNLQWVEKETGESIGCFSPCAKLTTAQGSDGGSDAGGWKHILGGLTPESPEAQMYCCPTPPISSGQCSAGPAARSSYAQAVTQIQQCNSYTYAYDDAKGLARCGPQTKFELIFCPKEDQQPSEIKFKAIVPEGVKATYNEQPVSNNQELNIVNGAVVKLLEDASQCVLKVDTNQQVTGDSGTLCAQLIINNTTKTLTFPEAPQPPKATFKVQFNFNPTFGVSAALNDRILNNAEPIEASQLPQNSVLKAFQGNKSASCNLTISPDNVTRGQGELCLRLNIVKEGNEKIHVYLPADIPDTGDGGVLPEAPKYVVFGMDPSMYAEFLHHIVTNGSKIALDNLGNATQINLIAYQHDISASCMIGKSGDSLSIIQDTGLLCSGGLVLQTQNNGDIYIGLPNPLPQAAPSGDSKSFGLGIAAGMTITVNDQVVRWDSRDKTVYFPQGQTVVKILGNNGLIRECPITLNQDKLTWPNVPACVGVVVHGNVLYFPAF